MKVESSTLQYYNFDLPIVLTTNYIDKYSIHFYLIDRGDSVTLLNNNISATAWLDRKVVTVMASNTQPFAVGTVLQRQVNTTRAPVPCPESIIILYNKYMGGVDRGDQLRGYYNYKIKSRKLYKYIVFFLFNVTVTNAYILRKHYNTLATFKNIKEFHVQLAKELIGTYCSRLRCGRNGGPIRYLCVIFQ